MENLFAGIRSEAIEYFESPPGRFGGAVSIPWHDGKNGLPSSHLCDSQVCCVNLLFPLRHLSDATTILLRTAFSDCVEAIPVQDGGDGLLEFEWVGDPTANLIGEGSPRTRGANATSTDAAAAFTDAAGGRHLVLIEWKYTESYRGSEAVGTSKFDEPGRGRTRRRRYQGLFEASDGPVKTNLVSLEDLGYEPFYQFFRQQLLAQALEAEWDTVRVLHIAPRANVDFRAITPARLDASGLGDAATSVWSKLIRDESAFRSVYTEELFAPLLRNPHAGLAEWTSYVSERYAFMQA